MMACVDSNSRTLTATCCFSAVLVHDYGRSSLGNSRLHQLANECGRQASTSRESNCSSAGVVSGQIRLECCHGIAAHGVKRTMARGCFEARNELPVQAERGHPVADALLGLGCCGMDGSTHFLQRGPILRR